MKYANGWLLSAAACTLLLTSVGCTTAKRAVSAASARSGCPAAKIKIVQEDGRSAVLDVCGSQQQWAFHPLNGYEYDGPATPPKRTANKK